MVKAANVKYTEVFIYELQLMMGDFMKKTTEQREVTLSICTNPLIRTYSYYGFINAILASDKYVGDVAAEIELEDYKKKVWNKEFEQLSINIEGDHIKFIRDDSCYKMNGCLYRPLLEMDSIHVKICSQLLSQPWGAINIFISDLDAEHILEDDNYICRLGVFNKDGVYVRTYNEQKNIKQFSNTFFKHLMITNCQGEISFFAGNSADKMSLLWTEKISNMDLSNKNIGVQIKLNDSAYMNWLFSNYIQLSCDIENIDSEVQYFYGLQKNWQYYINNFFVNYSIKKKTELSKWGVEPLEYIKYCICNGRYVETWINQYYVKGRKEYQKKDHFHQNLIYGFSDDTQEFYILGYTNNGLMAVDRISYQDFLDNRNSNAGRDILVEYELEMDGKEYIFDVNYVTQMVYQYLTGTNSSLFCHHLFPGDKRKYGIDIYDELMKQKGIQNILYDRRMTHIIYEHKECMKERIEFRRKRAIFSATQVDLLLEKLEPIIIDAKKLRNVSLKYAMVEWTQERFEDIKRRLENLKKKDADFMKTLYQLLIEVNHGKNK